MNLNYLLLSFYYYFNTTIVLEFIINIVNISDSRNIYITLTFKKEIKTRKNAWYKIYQKTFIKIIFFVY